MTEAILAGVGLLTAGALVVAWWVVSHENASIEGLYTQVAEAAQTASAQVCEVLTDDTTDERLVAARLTGATEFVHMLPSVGDIRRSSGVPSIALLLAGVLVVGALVFATVDRVEDRKGFQACVEAVDGHPRKATTTTTKPATPKPGGQGRTTATMTTGASAGWTAEEAKAVLAVWGVAADG